MKKILCLISSLLISWVTYCIPIKATPSHEPSKTATSSFFNDTRIGIGLALEYLYADVNLKIQPPPRLRDIESQQSQTGKHFQVAPCVEFGKFFTNEHYLGVLLIWHYSGLKSKAKIPANNSQNFVHEFKLNHYTDVLMKGGYKLAPRMMIYGLIGPTLTKWAHTSKMIMNGQLQPNQGNFQLSKTSLGLGLGIGCEYLFKKNYAFSIDYTYHLHRSASTTQSITILRPLGGPLTGNVNKKVDLSFSTVAVRFTTFFSL